MFTVSIVDVEHLTEDLVYKHVSIFSECGNCGVCVKVFTPALGTTRILRLKKKGKGDDE